MPTPKKPGSGRIEVRAEPWFTDMLATAAVKTGRTLSGYVRFALGEQLRRDGYNPEGGEPVRPPGRPGQEPAQAEPDVPGKAAGKPVGKAAGQADRPTRKPRGTRKRKT